MKPCFLSLLFLTCFSLTLFAQETPKADDALLLEYYQGQRFADALDYLKKTYPEPITDLKTLASMAYTSQMAGKLSDADGYYQRIYDKDSTGVALLFSLGNINVRRGNNAKALVYYKKILLRDSTNFNVYKQLATLSQNMGNGVAYIGFLQKANRINPTDPDVAFDLASFYINAKAYPHADTIISVAFAADTANFTLLEEKALIDYHLKKFPETIDICTKLMQQGERSGSLINMLGTSYFEVKKYNECITTFQMLEGNKEATETSYYYTGMSFKALNNQDKAIAYMKLAIKEAISNNVDSYYNEIGDSYDQLNQSKNAVTYFQKSLLYDQKPGITYYLLGNLYDIKLKNKKLALKYYKKYLATKPPKTSKNYTDYTQSRIVALAN